MHLGKDSAYGVFAVVHMTTHRDDMPITREDLSESCGIPPESLTAILDRLVEAKIIRHDAESPGKFAPSKPPGEITLLDIAEAIEGPQEIDLMLPGHAESRGVSTCGSQPPLKPLASIAASLLKTKTIESLLNLDK